MYLAWSHPLDGPWLGPSPAEVSGSSLLSWRSQTHAWAHRGLRLLPTPSVVTPSCSSGVCCLRSALVEFTGSACFCRCSWPGSAPTEVPGLGPDLHKSLFQDYSLEGPRLAPGLADLRPQPTPLVVAPMSKSRHSEFTTGTNSITYLHYSTSHFTKAIFSC